MPDLHTHSTSAETMDVDPILLHETGSTRLLFYPMWVQTSDNHLRGGFRYEKKGRNDTWEEFEGRRITTLHRDEAYELNLSGEDMATLFSNLESIQSLLGRFGHQWGDSTFQLASNNAQGIFLQIGNIDNRQLVIDQLRQLESTDFQSIENALSSARLQQAITDIQGNSTNGDESFWQTFFNERPWILQQIFHFPVYYLNGETYLGGKNTQGRGGQGGVATDFLYKNGSNSCFAVIEIKTPVQKLVGSEYRGRDQGQENVSYAISRDVTGGLVQAENQVRVVTERFRDNLQEDYPELVALDPTAVLIVGDKTSLDEDEKRSFNLFRKSLGTTIVMTYDELLARLEILKEIYE